MLTHQFLIGLSKMTKEPSQSENLSIDEVKHIAKLSRLALNEDEINNSRVEMEAIFEHINKLQSIQTDGVIPLDHPTELANHVRSDISTTALSLKEVLKNAPKTEGDYFSVPKVLGGEP